MDDNELQEKPTSNDSDTTGSQRESKPENEYKVGPYHPPKETQYGNRPLTQEEIDKRNKTVSKKKIAREMMRRIMDMKMKFNPASKVYHQLMEAFGDPREYTVLELVTMRQVQAAINMGDTKAASFLLSHIYGPPKQVTEVQGGEDLFRNKSDDELNEMLKQTLQKINAE